ncbi:hypothetical protein DFH08DRAFT_813388 [Mycena albidolilacea]|uniref:Uncharacterized protein n=1 Tax=Mycena albidolilacea TaxID=1033008 RepID=A0AAD7EMD9_9AGAR|nr:hypothetical protein DFH08DRAFT_813388 [Mycena albidolilacea]
MHPCKPMASEVLHDTTTMKTSPTEFKNAPLPVNCRKKPVAALQIQPKNYRKILKHPEACKKQSRQKALLRHCLEKGGRVAPNAVGAGFIGSGRSCVGIGGVTAGVIRVRVGGFKGSRSGAGQVWAMWAVVVGGSAGEWPGSGRGVAGEWPGSGREWAVWECDSHVSLKDFTRNDFKLPPGCQLPAALIVLVAPANVGVGHSRWSPVLKLWALK